MHSPRRGFHYTAPPNPDGERTPMTDTDAKTDADADSEEAAQDAIAPSKPTDRLAADD
ncbi:uncharacterized protein Nmag_1406 [Natrialba magadii ATCC 43099]|uniref:Uncharacterized protein n=1 Tax=Natrialba magadii (strain ATCC 43099 / DSM 3394 / CCM 3739 / CIP 104546 / IAM 13178 / JCM 8861 / NBRC 102185 / NCIMB 2190 / MS3) TaxID=547559 RepID=D3ST39_NATMM|nr:hypothetical protein [Natrialba magadii]ADD04985.1 uncharacterized protein Nmag_1406 [Natrialba magadii ATCC 43099]ELY24031.1 hypothetical protein C500_19545 [Natrialba magadii ATCC 43099]